MDEKITIIDGAPPIFEQVNDAWAMGLNESPVVLVPAMTRLRTTNGHALVERCHRAWRHHGNIQLHYRNDMGLEQTAPILAARNVETANGHVLVLWVYLDQEHVEYELDEGDDESADDNLNQ
jgi:hypothetical protein